MAKVTIILEDTEEGLSITNKFEPQLEALEDDAELTTAQRASFDVLQSLAAAADEVVVEDAVYAKSNRSKGRMH